MGDARPLHHATRSSADFFSSAKTFALPVGSYISRSAPRGYFIDLRVKAETPVWPPAWFPDRSAQVFVVVAQWGLGAYERYVAGEGVQWLEGARACAEYLVAEQEATGSLSGAWTYRHPCPHTYRLNAPWVCAMAQGEGASLLARMAVETKQQRFFDAAQRAIRAMRIPIERGGPQGTLDGLPFPQEYPTTPPAHVLNGGIFALWGYWDVAAAGTDAEARGWFEEGLDCLARNIHRWDTGYWSRYDLYPHPVANVASSFYHTLHIAQLDAILRVVHRAELELARERFVTYRESQVNAYRAFGAKALFRIIVPRNSVLARRLPWTR
jgi:heparosan-N-sulfate-glucuronate 5-epimerase